MTCIFNKMWAIVPSCTNEPKLITLQWKILHMIYPTNKYLCKIGFTEEEKCIDCNDTDTLCHFFYRCKNINFVWTIVENDVNALCDEHITITESDAIFGYKGRTLCVICLL